MVCEEEMRLTMFVDAIYASRLPMAEHRKLAALVFACSAM